MRAAFCFPAAAQGAGIVGAGGQSSRPGAGSVRAQKEAGAGAAGAPRAGGAGGGDLVRHLARRRGGGGYGCAIGADAVSGAHPGAFPRATGGAGRLSRAAQAPCAQMASTLALISSGSSTLNQSSRKMRDLACRIASSAPSENLPSGSQPNTIAISMPMWPIRKS